MICPYMKGHELCSRQISYDYDEDGRIKKETMCYSVKNTPNTCAEGECAVWKEGECGYYFDLPTLDEGDDADGSEGTTEVRE